MAIRTKPRMSPTRQPISTIYRMDRASASIWTSCRRIDRELPPSSALKRETGIDGERHCRTWRAHGEVTMDSEDTGHGVSRGDGRDWSPQVAELLENWHKRVYAA